ncbi:hypothetical protein [Fibrella forsythiae]|uniref:Lipoprotein n=1 Tax=Fibrella forsythiae TaxID=2817061 RepID=A0ABS3JVH1_9BACT|nr:hypothetical protein [Fibrella forsythiae]MBO0953174.1 hypothetical protein [Fibrella forsythiae]
MKTYFAAGLWLLALAWLCASCSFFKLIDSVSSLKLPVSCQNYVPQKYRFGSYPIEVKASKPTLHPGDTIRLNLRLSQAFYDSLSSQYTSVTGQVALFVRLTTVASQSTSNPFAIDTTIYKVFDQHFSTRMLVGTRTTPYTFDCVQVNGYWELAIEYIALKKGTYMMDAAFRSIKTGEPDLPPGQCMLGNAETFGAKTSFRSVNNQLLRIYPLSPYAPGAYFGFIVE